MNPKLLLHPPIPLPLHEVNPRNIMGKEWWDKQRKLAYEAAEFCCEACGVHKSKARFHQWLEAHEIYKIDFEEGTMKFIRLCALCFSCHNYIHRKRLSLLVEQNQFPKAIYDEVIKHGDKLTKKFKKQPLPEHIAWNKWRLLFEGKSYAPKYQSYADWYYSFHGVSLPVNCFAGYYDDYEMDI